MSTSPTCSPASRATSSASCPNPPSASSSPPAPSKAQIWDTAGQERYVRSASSLRLLLPLFNCLGAVGGGRSAPWIARVADALLDADACA
jgi:hypothetical protein